MAQFQAFANAIEVNGQTVLSIVKGMEHFEKNALKILAENGIQNPRPGKWYCQQSWLNAFKKISEEVGPYALYCIGTKIPENAQFPPGIDSLEKALESIDTAYHMNHRGGEIGNYNFQKSPDGSLHFTCNNPYPCEFDRGIIEGIARKFIDERHHLMVRHDDAVPCRDRSGDSCTYHIEISQK
ncbi:MAG: hypothetical protein HY881_10270 [Deltaproteobacteria bacterium]|nr:hypothetical protein [Deltaproteobacteria bacterium]